MLTYLIASMKKADKKRMDKISKRIGFFGKFIDDNVEEHPMMEKALNCYKLHTDELEAFFRKHPEYRIVE